MIDRKSPRILGSFVVLFLALRLVAAPESHYIVPGQLDGIALLGPPPEKDSAEARADLGLVQSVCLGRTKAEEARAFKDSTLAFTLFAPIIGPQFQLDKLPKTKYLLEKVKAEIGGCINVPKDYYKRTRPYMLDTNLWVGKPEGSFSYPSGHSSRGTVYSMVLAELFPEKKEAILEMGRQIGWDRVIIAKHFLSDVRAGRVLGGAIMRELMASPEFQNDLREAKAECVAAHP